MKNVIIRSRLSDADKRELREYHLKIDFCERHVEELIDLVTKRGVFSREKNFFIRRRMTVKHLLQFSLEDSWTLSEELYFYMSRFAQKALEKFVRLEKLKQTQQKNDAKRNKKTDARA